MTPSLEGWPTKAKETPSPHEVRLALLDTNPVYQSLGEIPHKTCRWHMLRFDTGRKGGIPFLPITKLLGLTCVI